jgi:hypothetical protein
MKNMGILGVLLLIAGVVLFFVERFHRGRATSLKAARSVTVAELQSLSTAIASEIGGGNWRDYIKLTGMIRCERPLISELKQEPCVHYQMSVTREYEETVTKQDSQAKLIKIPKGVLNRYPVINALCRSFWKTQPGALKSTR